MQHLLRDPRALELFVQINLRSGKEWYDKPRKDRIGVHAGTFHNLTVPDQLPVARILLLGANRTCEIGRSSPICEPRLTNFWSG